ncbi:hypothetical protein DFH08DRAFT_676878 [Mycena albidolilacea]|uniref:Uncharacterized protein n=1 Tax=Mycena albidolilacea TaxID=1033008 RepID=A0AAD7AW97_9AGAR|nr:hypothetical protein DFH08DRAFT_676878 [Mycena albidolilacea]
MATKTGRIWLPWGLQHTAATTRVSRTFPSTSTSAWGGGKNVRASGLKKRGANTSKMQRLAKDLDAIDVELEDHTARLATKYSMKPKNVRRRLVASSNYKLQRKPSLYNAKISAVMADLNADREDENRLTMPEVKVLVKDDPSLLEGYTTEDEAQMLADVAAKCEHKHRGTRSNNVAANVDIKHTMARLVEELNGLAQCTNMVGFAMFSRGHLHDTSTPTIISTGGALDFFREVLKREPADVSALLELWAVNREQGASWPHTLLAMQKECTEAIAIGLMAVTKRTKIAMNYENYIRSIVQGKNIGLVGWPQGVAFKRMSLQSAITPLQILRDALRAGTCRWKVLTPTERERIIKNFEDMVEKGEVKVKARKSSRATTKNEPPAKKRKNTSAGDDDGAPPAKCNKTSAGENKPDVPVAARPRPQPRRLHKKPASAAAPARPMSLTPRSPASSSRGPATSSTTSGDLAPCPTVKGKRGGPPGQRQ